MTIDFGLILYIENAILTAGAILAWIHRDGHTLMAFKNETDDAPPPFLALLLGAIFWPLAWACAAVGLVAVLMRKLAARHTA